VSIELESPTISELSTRQLGRLLRIVRAQDNVRDASLSWGPGYAVLQFRMFGSHQDTRTIDALVAECIQHWQNDVDRKLDALKTRDLIRG